MNAGARTSHVVGAALLIVGMVIFVTWPQALVMSTSIAAHADPMFTMWRFAWVAHAVREAPGHLGYLFNANILYPAARTFTFADMTFLEAAIAAPLLWAHVSPVVVYNILLLGGVAASGFAMFVLARYLTGATGPALIAAAIFTMAPYRIEHFMHLELQWAMWIPLTFWALHRAIDERSLRAGAFAGLFFFLQIASCVYYGIFLAVAAAALVLLLVLTRPSCLVPSLPGLAIAGGVAVALSVPYMWPYLETARMAGPRAAAEVAQYSATAVSYLASPPQNWLWGWSSPRWGHPELSLYPGIIAVVLALLAATARPRRTIAIYAAIAALTFDLSLGVNGWLYPALARLGVLGGLRSPSRFTIVTLCALGVLAAFGAQAVQERFLAGELRRRAPFVIAVALVLIGIDYANTGMYLTTATRPWDGTVYRVVRSAGPGAMIELPLPVPEGLPGADPFYQYWSISHWHPIVNGYTAVYTPDYIETLSLMRTFPDDRSIERLKTLGVRYLIVHKAFLQDQYPVLLNKIGYRRELRPYGEYTDPIGPASLFVIE
jgi:hypothetical protein